MDYLTSQEGDQNLTQQAKEGLQFYYQKFQTRKDKILTLQSQQRN